MVSSNMILKLFYPIKIACLLVLFVWIAVILFIDLFIFLNLTSYYNIYTLLGIAALKSLIGLFAAFAVIFFSSTKIKREIKNGNIQIDHFYGLFSSLVAALCLITPGFFSTIVGLIICIPVLSRFMGKAIAMVLKIPIEKLVEHVYVID